MGTRIKAQSADGTPLTIKWAVGSIECKELETEQRSNDRRLATLICAFVIGLVFFGLSTWLPGKRFWFLDTLMGALVICFWVQRWGEKHLGWRSVGPDNGSDEVFSSNQIKKRRLAYSLPGFAIGLGAFGLVAWLLGETNWVFDGVLGGFATCEVAIGLGERFRGLPTRDDLAMVRTREEMSPLDLKPDDKVPLTLKTASEREAKQ